MKVLSIEPPNHYDFITTDEKYWNEYRRFGPDCWEQLMGMSWEECSSTEVEAAYQKKLLDLIA